MFSLFSKECTILKWWSIAGFSFCIYQNCQEKKNEYGQRQYQNAHFTKNAKKAYLPKDTENKSIDRNGK